MSEAQLAARRASQIRAVAAIRGVVRVPKVTYRCIDCGKERTQYPSEFKKGPEEYRCRKCGSKIAAQKKTGSHLSKEAKDKISAANVDKEYTDDEKIRQMESHGRQIWYGGVRYYLEEPRAIVPEDPSRLLDLLFGRFDRKENQRRISRERRGPLNPCWKGGISTLNHAIRDCEKGLAWRRAVFERDNYTCRVTGYSGTGLNAHHIVPLSKLIREYSVKTLDEALIIPEFWDVSNGITLKGDLHKSKHKRKTKVKETWQIKLVCSGSKMISSL
jgi:DNA-directed RNA polymerase subunit RPC12/RpoP/5-methylcytosine-specific restriction endonuclease McrA